MCSLEDLIKFKIKAHFPDIFFEFSINSLSHDAKWKTFTYFQINDLTNEGFDIFELIDWYPMNIYIELMIYENMFTHKHQNFFEMTNLICKADALKKFYILQKLKQVS